MDERVVYLATAPNEPIARMWEQVLQDEGIRTLVQPLGTGIGGWGSAATLEHELAVRASDVDRARLIIAELEGDVSVDDTTS